MKLGLIPTGPVGVEEEKLEIYPEIGEITDEEELEVDTVLDELYSDATSLEDVADGLDEAIFELREINELDEGLNEAIRVNPNVELSNPTMASIRASLRLIRENNDLPNNNKLELVTLQSFKEQTNTEKNKITLAGVGDALKSLWEKIKSALKALWKGIKKFWEKHISSLGIMKKKIKKYAKKVMKVKGSIDYSTAIVMPGGLDKTMAFKGDINTKGIINLIKLHREETKKSVKFAEEGAKIMEDLANMKDSRKDKTLNFDEAEDKLEEGEHILELGDAQEPLATGFYGHVELEEKGEDDKAPLFKFVKESTDEFAGDDNRKIQNDGAKQLLVVLQELKALHEDTVDLGKNFQKQNDKFDKASNKIEHVVKSDKSNMDKYHDRVTSGESKLGAKTPNAEERAARDADDEEDAKADKTSKAKQITIAFRSVASTLPAVNSKMSSLNLKLMKGTLKYIKLCLKNYTRVGD